MPGCNGTGPSGRGPGTGKGRGLHIHPLQTPEVGEIK